VENGWHVVKKVQDHYFNKAKKEGYPARSVYKLEEADKKYRILKKGGRVLDIGCHPGSWTMYAAKIIGPAGLVVGIDLQQTKIHVQGGASVRLLTGDITDPEIIDRVKSVTDSFDVVLSDMAPKTTGNKWADQQQSLNLSRRAFEVARELLDTGGNFYCKVFEGEDFKEFFDSVRKWFTNAKIVKPKSSRSESREVFVLGIGYIKKQQNFSLQSGEETQ